MKGTRTQPLRDYVSLFWLGAVVVLTGVHRWVPGSVWLMIHLVLLGALTHAALVWSEHFAQTLLRRPPDPSADARILVLAAGSAAVFVGVPIQAWWLVVAGASAVGISVVWHSAYLVRELKRALPNRFRIVSHYYVAAAACLIVGVSFGATLARGWGDEWHARLLLAHLAANVLGWLGLTVTGTLVTFWPTMLRVRMDDRAEHLARQALPVLLGGLVVIEGGALVGQRWLAFVGLVAYAAGLIWWGRALVRPMRTHWFREFAPASVGAALVWGAVGVVWLGVLVVRPGAWSRITDSLPTVAAVLAAGFGAQLLTGALSYLVPSVIGGGPNVVRAGQGWLNRAATWRLVVINAGILVWLLPSPSWVRVTVSGLVLVGFVMFLPLIVKGASASAKARQQAAAAVGEGAGSGVLDVGAGTAKQRIAAAKAEQARTPWSYGQLVGAVTALVLAITVGVGIDPVAAGLPTAAAASGSVAPTGKTVRIAVTTQGMAFHPNSVTVARGDRLVVTVTNTDPTTSHDLVVGSARTPRLKPGESAELDAGIVGASIQGYCSVAGHRQMGMVFDIAVAGASTTPSDHGGHATTGSAAPLSHTFDPVLPPLTAERVRPVTLRVQEVPLEVAPGIWQRRWTYNGGSVGPTLHGRVGDVFEVTLVNDGSIGHSIDFHAGALAPDRPMRTIAPGETLTYRFTAERAGIWMYHCSTMPMSVHIGAGMTGAVVIEPDGLPTVDRSYVLVQSEIFLTSAASTPQDATEVDADKVFAERPDKVVFNGIANQYDQVPFQAKVGERVRFWVLAAGPNRPLSFHVVGGQFDTVWKEGRYELRAGADGSGSTGSQALGLLPAQGGFVELTFPEAGHYPVVNHVMVDAERGAHGIVAVS